MLECVVNVSEGRRADVLDALAGAALAAGPVLDVHADPDHHRAVFTLVGEEAPRALAAEAVARLDIGDHRGVHPRLGVVDVVPFVPLDGGDDLGAAIAARDAFARWAAEELGLPCFLYGPGRSLPDVRRAAFAGLVPDVGPPGPHPTAGATCVGARPVLVAYNLWLAPGADGATARRLAAGLRGPAVRALAFEVAGHVQVSCNLIDPLAAGPAEVYDAVAREAEVARAELVGLAPASVLAATPPGRWAELGLDPARTIEARLREAGLDANGRRR